MSSDAQCFGTIGNHIAICTRDRLKGGIYSLALIKQGQTSITDWDNATEWGTAIAAGDVVLIEKISGEVAAPSPVTSPSEIAGQPDVVNEFNWVLNFRDQSLTANNIQFYEDLNDFVAGGIVWYEIKNDKIKVVENNDVRFQARPEVLRDSGTTQVYVVDCMWETIEQPQLFNAPAGIFQS